MVVPTNHQTIAMIDRKTASVSMFASTEILPVRTGSLGAAAELEG